MVKIDNGDFMRKTLIVWGIIIFFIMLWVYYLVISPFLFNKKNIIMPDIIDLDEQIGLSILKENKIEYQIIYIESEEDKILYTYPDNGVSIKPNFKVEVYIGKILPNTFRSFKGMVFNDVKEEIENWAKENKINIKINYVNTDNLDGVIIGESIIEGEKLEGIDEIIIDVSKNDEVILMPNLVGSHINDAIAFADRNNLTLVFIYIDTPILNNIVVNQAIPVNTPLRKNSNKVIELYISIN